MRVCVIDVLWCETRGEQRRFVMHLPVLSTPPDGVMSSNTHEGSSNRSGVPTASAGARHVLKQLAAAGALSDHLDRVVHAGVAE